MSERFRGRPSGPKVEVIKKAGDAKAVVRPVTPTPLRVQASAPSERAPKNPSSAPPTAEAILALARRERVPNRIAKGELLGKMKCRIWKKLHPIEAARFLSAWKLVEAHPNLELADAFTIVESGLSLDDLRARRARHGQRASIRQARSTVSNVAIEAILNGFIEAKTELAIGLAERALFDSIVTIQPLTIQGARSGRHEKLHVVFIAPRALWEQLLPGIKRDARLTQKPAPVSRQPARRPVSDPRIFQPFVDQQLALKLRNGIELEMTLAGIGPYDLVLQSAGGQLIVPLHAILSWSAGKSSISTDAGDKPKAE